MNLDDIRRRDWAATYPTREAALALVEWIKADDWGSLSELDRRLVGVGIGWTDDFTVAAERCWEVYGYPELEGQARARRVAEVTMRPNAPRRGVAGGSDGSARPFTADGPDARPDGSQTMTYGLTPRR
ncbi:MAG: hypothetical protein EOR67_28635 [Mesorhizobium sp.]|uniref:hypothetical protein n=1 Tax=Mesorhizobium sp. TaxID=1871066 RepID=UPI000FE7B94F|nr:hypothetical protein [Mesorhizobium sp.]RWL81902.1 MAG: hypothetical protein EOR67_28635 [Mesorhizobium sp.]RWL82282.1 MAG: hypothetical protein EOR69_16360 [Mesorhizobium sp.]RWL98653.1 MAG: hypothetical protein EOR70_12605 [Mesorhizobium sp.]